MNKRHSRALSRTLAFAPLLFGGGPATAAGFAIAEQSASGLGTAFAGGAALAKDASTVYYNPAGMTRLASNELKVGTHFIVPSAEFTNQGSTFNVTGAPIPGGNGGDAGELVMVPNVYYVRGINPNLKVGLGVNAPFGLETRYNSEWVGRYHGIKSKLITVNVNPSIAYRVSDAVSLGAGVSVMYADAELTNSVDYGLIGFGAFGCMGPGTSDGFARVKGDDVGVGFNLGALFEPTESTRVGFAFRSKVEQDLEGDASFDTPSSCAQNVAASLNQTPQDIKTELTLPETVSISAFHQLTPNWTVMGDGTWTKWNRLEEIRIEFAEGAPDVVTTLDWENTWRLSLGTEYSVDAQWTVRAGIAYDETPIPNARRRTPRIPDEDRIWIALGFSYQRYEQLSVDVGYTHIFFDDARIDKDGTERENLARGALRGKYDSHVDIVSLALRWQFL